MRKFLAILLAVLMVVPAFAFTATAEETTPAQKLNIIPIITEYDMPDTDMNADATAAWRGSDGGNWIYELYIDKGKEYNGAVLEADLRMNVLHYSAADKAVVRDWTGVGMAIAGWVKLGYQYFTPVDLSGIWGTGAICFDLYLSDPDAIGADTITFDYELRSVGGNDDNEWNAHKDNGGAGAMTLSQLYGGDLQKGWNHFEIPLTYFGKVDKADDGTTPDNTQINYFRLLNYAHVSMGTEGVDSKIMMKNIYFVDQCVYEPHQNDIHTVLDFETSKTADGNSWSLIGGSAYSTGNMDVDGDGDMELALIHAVEAIHESNLPYYGLCGRGGGWDTYPTSGYGPKKILNISNSFDSNEYVSGICFDLFVTDTKVDLTGAIYDTVAEADGKKTTMASAEDLAFTDSIMDTVWSFELSSGGGDGKAEISWSGSLKTLFGYQLVPGEWCTVVLRFDERTAEKTSNAYGDFVATEAKWLRMMTGESGTHGFVFTGDLTVAIDNIRTIRDIPEEEVSAKAQTSVFTMDAYASNQEKIHGVNNAQLLNNQAMIVRRFTENATTAIGRYAILRNFDPMNVAGMDTVCFDFYVDVYGSAVTAGLSDSDKAAIKTLLTANNLQMEISSSSSQDDYEVRYLTSVNTLLGKGDDDIPATGWYHVEIPFNPTTFTHSTASNKTGVFDWETVKYITMFLEKSITLPVGVNVVLAMDNVYFKDSTYVAPTAEVSAEGTLSLDNSFNMRYTVSAYYLVVSNPVVSVTFDGKTTAVDSSFYFEDILAHRLSDEVVVTALVLNEDHELIRWEFEPYSVKQYAENKLTDANSSDKLKRLLSDALYYGAAAQSLIGYNTDDLASDVKGILAKNELSQEALNACRIKDVLVGKPAENGPAWKSATLVLDSQLALRFAFTGEAETVTVFGSTHGTEDFMKATDKSGVEYYYIDCPVSVDSFGCKYTAYFNGDDSYCLNYSVNHYVATKYAQDSQLADLLAAIFNYGQSAEAYVAN